MDLDAYVAEHLPTWRHLERLTAKPRPTAADADEIVDLYQRCCTHLSTVQSRDGDPQTTAYLSWLVARARLQAVRPHTRPGHGIARFFGATFPAMLYRTRRWWWATTIACLALAALFAAWMLSDPAIERAWMSEADVAQLVQHDFENYYSEHAATSFALRVWTNNAWVAAQCLILGVLGLPVLYVLYSNALHLAVIAAIMIGHGRGALFFGLILPHGLLELTCVFVAGALGLRLFWSWVSPGDRPRMRALAEEGRSTLVMSGGLAALLALTGLVEAFVTPSPLPTWARVGIGIACEVGFFLYVYVVGRRAHLAGVTTDVSPWDAGGFAPTSTAETAPAS